MATDPSRGTAAPASPGSLLGPPVDDPAAARAACSARALERVGVPVVLALVDRRPGAPAVAAGAPAGGGPAGGGRGGGAELVALFDRYAEVVAPAAADDDAAALYSVVELIGYAHVLPGAAPASGGGHR